MSYISPVGFSKVHECREKLQMANRLVLDRKNDRAISELNTLVQMVEQGESCYSDELKSQIYYTLGVAKIDTIDPNDKSQLKSCRSIFQKVLTFTRPKDIYTKLASMEIFGIQSALTNMALKSSREDNIGFLEKALAKHCDIAKMLQSYRVFNEEIEVTDPMLSRFNYLDRMNSFYVAELNCMKAKVIEDLIKGELDSAAKDRIRKLTSINLKVRPIDIDKVSKKVLDLYQSSYEGLLEILTPPDIIIKDQALSMKIKLLFVMMSSLSSISESEVIAPEDDIQEQKDQVFNLYLEEDTPLYLDGHDGLPFSFEDWQSFRSEIIESTTPTTLRGILLACHGSDSDSDDDDEYSSCSSSSSSDAE
jgi:hypothetical protein